jgi:hypothetical protein
LRVALTAFGTRENPFLGCAAIHFVHSVLTYATAQVCHWTWHLNLAWLDCLLAGLRSLKGFSRAPNSASGDGYFFDKKSPHSKIKRWGVLFLAAPPVNKRLPVGGQLLLRLRQDGFAALSFALPHAQFALRRCRFAANWHGS